MVLSFTQMRFRLLDMSKLMSTNWKWIFFQLLRISLIGPKGIGFLYVRKGIELLPYADGGAQESAHRAGTENVASIVGMATALKANCDFLKQHQQHILELENTLIAGLNSAGISYCRNGRGNHAAWPNKSVIFGEGRRSNSPPYGSCGGNNSQPAGPRWGKHRNVPFPPTFWV